MSLTEVITIIKRGSALIFIVILMVPMMMLSFYALDSAVTNYKININMVTKQQACYFAEAGICFALKNIKSLNYPEYLNRTYYIRFSDDSIDILDTTIKSSSMTVVSVYASNKEYTISSTGSCMGCSYTVNKKFKVL